MFYVSLRKSTPKIGVKFLVFFTFFINFFYENINQEHYLLQDCAFWAISLWTYVVKIVWQASLPSFLTWVSLPMFCLVKWKLSIQLNIILIGRWDTWLVHELRVTELLSRATCKRNILCPTSCTEISLWKRPTSNIW